MGLGRECVAEEDAGVFGLGEGGLEWGECVVEHACCVAGGRLVVWSVCWKGEEERGGRGKGRCLWRLDTADLVLKVGRAFL